MVGHFVNPTRRVKQPKFERKYEKYLDKVQTAKLTRLLDNEPYQNQVMVRYFLLKGVRRVVLCGLERRDIDSGNNMITICLTSQYLPEKGTITIRTKTDYSVRTISLPEQVFELLKAHRKWQREQRIAMGDRWVASNRVIAQDVGTLTHPNSYKLVPRPHFTHRIAVDFDSPFSAYEHNSVACGGKSVEDSE